MCFVRVENRLLFSSLERSLRARHLPSLLSSMPASLRRARHLSSLPLRPAAEAGYEGYRGVGACLGDGSGLVAVEDEVDVRLQEAGSLGVGFDVPVEA